MSVTSARLPAPANKITTIGKRVSVFAVTLAATLTIAVTISAPTAEASALGAAGFGPSVTVKGAKVSMGTYYGYISGAGTRISYVKGWPYLNSPAGTVCNWSMTAEFFDTANRWYKTVPGKVNSGCFNAARRATANVLPINANMKPGKMCSTLKQNGQRLTSVCHSIH